MIKFLITLSILFFALQTLSSQHDISNEDKTMRINSSILIDNVYNAHGGLNSGASSIGLFDFSAKYAPFSQGFLRNTSVYARFLKTGGKAVSENLIGDVQIASNIEGRASRFVYELLLTQRVGNLNFYVGLHDLNAEFMLSTYAGDFINSSFGIFPAVSLNIPIPTFPVTSLGGVMLYSWPTITIASGIYNLNHDYVNEDEFVLENHLFKKGFLALSEIRYQFNIAGYLSGEYKIGAFYKDCHPPEGILISEGCIATKTYGLFFIADQDLWILSDSRKLAMFGQAGIVPRHSNFAPNYFGLGFTLITENERFFPDFLGLAMGSVMLNSYNTLHENHVYKRETVIELSLKKKLMKHIALQPDIQYIVNPSGVYTNALIGILRLHISLNE